MSEMKNLDRLLEKSRELRDERYLGGEKGRDEHLNHIDDVAAIKDKIITIAVEALKGICGHGPGSQCDQEPCYIAVKSYRAQAKIEALAAKALGEDE